MSGRLTGVLGLALFLIAGPARAGRRDFDIRDLPPAGERDRTDRDQAQALVESRRVAARTAAGAGARMTLNRHGLPKSWLRDGRALAPASGGTPEETARAFLRANHALLPFTASEIDNLRLASRTSSGRAVFVAFQQTWNGIDVYNGQIKVTLNDAGEVFHAGTDDVVPQLTVTNARRLTAEEAITAAYDSLSLGRPALVPLASTDGKTRYRNPGGDRFQPISADLTVFPITAAAGRLAHRLSLEIDAQGWYEILIDAEDGRLLFRHNLYESAAQARVWLQSPMADTARELVTFPEGWLPPTGSSTNGNNVDAYLDTNGDGRPDNNNANGLSAGRPTNFDQLFDFPFADGTTGANPRNFQASAVTNLFYFVNKAHDYYYDLGFDEAAGNFQFNNFGKGGAGNDPVLAESESALAVDNASFATPADGSSPRLRIGVFTRGTSRLTDDLDASLDGGIVLHEYGHGVSTRLVGARVSASCLSGVQSRAMGEGWSDYFASSFFNNPVQGAYVTQNPVGGLRRYSYSGYPYTYEDLGIQGFEVHDDGEIWAAALWDLRGALGKAVADRLVVDGLKATPCRPSMNDARDAILAADAANGGANRARIWQVFARHGLGSSSSGIDGQPFPGIYYNAAFDQPADLQGSGNPAIVGAPPAALPRGGEDYTYSIKATNPAGGTLAYSLTQGPRGMTVDNEGMLRWKAGYAQERIKVTVTDGKGGKVVHGFQLTPDTPLTLGSPVTIDGGPDAIGYFQVQVPAGAPILQFTVRGGVGDVDIDVFDPDGLNYLSFQDGNDETISIPTPKGGRWRVVYTGFRTFSGAALTASVITPTIAPVNTEITGLSGVTSSEVFYRFTVPAGATALAVTTFGGTGDLDLYLRRGLPATCQASSVVVEPCPRDVLFSESDGNAESIQVTDPGAGDWYIALTAYEGYSGATLLVTVTSPGAVSAAPTALSFRQAPGGSPPAAQSFELKMTGNTGAWSAVATTASGGGWLKVAPASGSGPANLQVSVSGATLAPGTYAGTVTVTAPGSAGSPLTVSAELTVAAAPTLAPAISSGGVIGGAGSAPPVTAISPGGLASVFGSNFAIAGTARAVQSSDLVNGVLPTVLGDACVLAGGRRAFLTFVSPTQINVQIPVLPLDAVVEVQVIANCGAPNESRSASISAPTAAATPELLYWTPGANGRRPVVAVHVVTGAYIGAAGLIPGLAFVPARPGDVLTLYGISFGPTNPSVAPGDAPPGAGSTVASPRVSLGAVELSAADILYAGVSPGIAGLYQVNIRVPASLPDGDHAVVLRLGSVSTPSIGYLTVGRN